MNTPRTIYPNISEEYAIRDGEELTYVLKAAGYSQREFADFIDKSKSHINDICHGRSPFTLRHQQSLIFLLTPDLYCLAVTRGRQMRAEHDASRQRAVEARMQADREEEE